MHKLMTSNTSMFFQIYRSAFVIGTSFGQAIKTISVTLQFSDEAKIWFLEGTIYTMH